MSIKKINIGNLANDGTGDDLREAFIKVNDNFDEMSVRLDNAVITVAENVGNGRNIFKEKLGNVLQFKTLVQGSNVLLTEHGDSITVTANSGLEQIIVLTEAGSIILPGGQQLLNVYGGQNIGTTVEVEDTDSYLRINVKGENLVQLDPNPTLAGSLNADGYNFTNVNSINANTYYGNLLGLVHGIDIRNINNQLLEFDFGSFLFQVNSIIDYIYLTVDIDLGSNFTSEPIQIDLGGFIV